MVRRLSSSWANCSNSFSFALSSDFALHPSSTGPRQYSVTNQLENGKLYFVFGDNRNFLLEIFEIFVLKCSSIGLLLTTRVTFACLHYYYYYYYYYYYLIIIVVIRQFLYGILLGNNSRSDVLHKIMYI